MNFGFLWANLDLGENHKLCGTYGFREFFIDTLALLWFLGAYGVHELEGYAPY